MIEKSKPVVSLDRPPDKHVTRPIVGNRHPTGLIRRLPSGNSITIRRPGRK